VGSKFAIMNVENHALDAQNLVSVIDFHFSAQGERSSRLAPMANVTIGHGNKQDVVPFSGPHRTRAAGLKFAIIRVCAKADDAQLTVVGGHRDNLRLRAMTRWKIETSLQ